MAPCPSSRINGRIQQFLSFDVRVTAGEIIQKKSPAKRKNTKTGFLSKKKGFKPVLPKVLEKLSKSPDVEDSNIHKNYQQAIKKSSIELGIFRLKLSKLLHLKDAVDTTKIIA